VFKFITHKSFLVNLLVIILIILLLVFGFFSLLGTITKHNEVQKVPNVIGKTYDEAKQILEAADLEAGIQDSTYVDTARALEVMRQSPDADAAVKSDRTIYLTINRAVPPKIDMPDLRGFSLTSAKLYLQSLGLKLGDTTFISGVAKNAVKEQQYNGEEIMPGTKINMGSHIDLVVGNGIGQETISVPDLLGMTVSQARAYLLSSNIELGEIIPQGTVTDTENAFVIKQNPSPYSQNDGNGEAVKNKIRPGQIMDIWISAMPPQPDSTAIQPQ
jgi:beta-lactam-binding protein with PASTA domain